jgi:predicted dehydrogenase
MGQNHYMEFHGSEGTLYNHIDWDTAQTLHGMRAGGGRGEINLPDELWAGVRRDTVHNTYRDIFREKDNMAREFVTAIVEQRDNPMPDFFDGARVQELSDAAVRSAQAHSCWVDV